MIKNRKVNKVEDGTKQVKQIYLQRGLKITRKHADSEFEPQCAEMADLGISLNCTFKKKHVPKIEQFNRNVKEHFQYARSAIPFKQIY